MKGHLAFITQIHKHKEYEHLFEWSVSPENIRLITRNGDTGMWCCMSGIGSKTRYVAPVNESDIEYCESHNLMGKELHYILNDSGFAIISRPNREQFPTSFLEYITGMSFEQLHKSYDAWRIATGDYEAKEKFYQS